MYLKDIIRGVISMKALLVNGSPRPRGCTYTALTELKNTLEAEGIEVELLHKEPMIFTNFHR